MRELEQAIYPPIEPARLRAAGRVRASWPRVAFVASLAAHVVAGYALSRQKWGEPPPAAPLPEFFLFEAPAPRPAEPAGEPAFEEPAPEVVERPPEPVPAPPRAADVAPQEPAVVIEALSESELAPVEEVLPALAPAPTPFVDFDEERRRAASEVVDELARENEYLTFTLDDIAPPRPEPRPEPPPSIFDGGGGPIGPKVGQLGRARTRLGHRLSEICNALTGGFSLMGFGSFCASASDGGRTGFLPEVRPEYLDLMPECVDTRDTAPALALEAPFPTVKCRLVRRDEFEEQP